MGIDQTHDSFLDILKRKNIQTVYQPIITMGSGEIFAFEALSRGPENSMFYSPLHLFSYAQEHGYLYSLEKTARELAIKNSFRARSNKNEKLFINISAKVIYDSNFTPGNTIEVLQKYNMAPENIVFEITERTAIQDFHSFRETLFHYRNQGFEVAIDDAGAGYSSLQAVSEIMPEYIKIDRSLIENVHKNEVKASILETFVHFGSKMKSKIIAEGIETKEELSFIRNLGVDFAQGFFICKPQENHLQVSEDAKTILSYHQTDLNTKRTHFVKPGDRVIVNSTGKIIHDYIVPEVIQNVIL